MGTCSCITNENKRIEPTRGRSIIQSEVASAVKLTCNLQAEINQFYEFIRVLGFGSFGTVREAVKINRGGNSPFRNCIPMRYAVKSIQKRKIINNFHMVKREIENLRVLDHPQIIKLHDIFEDSLYLHIVMDYCKGGDLMEFIIDKGPMDELKAAIIMKKILSALHYIHAMNIAHRDLKPENILLYDNSVNSDIVIIDFGISAKFDDQSMTSAVGTPYFVGPEVFFGSYGKECDIWSAGVLMYFILSGYLPFRAKTINILIEKITRGDYSFQDKLSTKFSWKNVSKSAKELIADMLQVSPKQRICLSDALQHSWFDLLNHQRYIPKLNNLNVQNLIKYKASNKLRNEILKIMVRDLNTVQIQELKQLFQLCDINNTGQVNLDDIIRVLQQNGLNIALDEVQKLYQSTQYLKHGQLKYSEFLALVLDTKELVQEENLWQVFNHLDWEQSGFISIEQLRDAIIQCGSILEEGELDFICQEFGITQVQGINFQQFKIIMNCFSEVNTPESSIPHDKREKRLSIRRVTNAIGIINSDNLKGKNKVNLDQFTLVINFLQMQDFNSEVKQFFRRFIKNQIKHYQQKQSTGLSKSEFVQKLVQNKRIQSIIIKALMEISPIVDFQLVRLSNQIKNKGKVQILIRKTQQITPLSREDLTPLDINLLSENLKSVQERISGIESQIQTYQEQDLDAELIQFQQFQPRYIQDNKLQDLIQQVDSMQVIDDADIEDISVISKQAQQWNQQKDIEEVVQRELSSYSNRLNNLEAIYFYKIEYIKEKTGLKIKQLEELTETQQLKIEQKNMILSDIESSQYRQYLKDTKVLQDLAQYDKIRDLKMAISYLKSVQAQLWKSEKDVKSLQKECSRYQQKLKNLQYEKVKAAQDCKAVLNDFKHLKSAFATMLVIDKPNSKEIIELKLLLDQSKVKEIDIKLQNYNQENENFVKINQRLSYIRHDLSDIAKTVNDQSLQIRLVQLVRNCKLEDIIEKPKLTKEDISELIYQQPQYDFIEKFPAKESILSNITLEIPKQMSLSRNTSNASIRSIKKPTPVPQQKQRVAKRNRQQTGSSSPMRNVERNQQIKKQPTKIVSKDAEVQFPEFESPSKKSNQSPRNKKLAQLIVSGVKFSNDKQNNEVKPEPVRISLKDNFTQVTKLKITDSVTQTSIFNDIANFSPFSVNANCQFPTYQMVQVSSASIQPKIQPRLKVLQKRSKKIKRSTVEQSVQTQQQIQIDNFDTSEIKTKTKSQQYFEVQWNKFQTKNKTQPQIIKEVGKNYQKLLKSIVNCKPNDSLKSQLIDWLNQRTSQVKVVMADYQAKYFIKAKKQGRKHRDSEIWNQLIEKQVQDGSSDVISKYIRSHYSTRSYKKVIEKVKQLLIGNNLQSLFQVIYKPPKFLLKLHNQQKLRKQQGVIKKWSLITEKLLQIQSKCIGQQESNTDVWLTLVFNAKYAKHRISKFSKKQESRTRGKYNFGLLFQFQKLRNSSNPSILNQSLPHESKMSALFSYQNSPRTEFSLHQTPRAPKRPITMNPSFHFSNKPKSRSIDFGATLPDILR